MPQFIRTVTVEIFRKGPSHNQLLSPLTEYLGICGESGVGSISIPYEQLMFNATLAELRYQDSDEEDQSPRQRALRTMGGEIGEVLGNIPGLAGALTKFDNDDSLLNLRLVTSASELALIPFELAKMPSSTGKPTDEWLALQASRPVCVTRRVRSVLPTDRHWPKSKKPKILFIVGLDIDDKLRKAHRKILEESVAPWATNDNPCVHELGPGENFENSTARNIGRELAEGYDYLHILAHGAESEATETPTFGLLLPRLTVNEASEDEFDVLTGDRMASLLRGIPATVAPPACALIASCDSANQSDVLAPGGSFAHAVHVAGVPLVVASQFPLTTLASAVLAEIFYADIPWGKHPLETLYRARARLHAEFAYTHDWASLVVYDALPDDLHAQLDEVCYQRARDALQNAQGALQNAQKELLSPDVNKGEQPDLETAKACAEIALNHLPGARAYLRECEGLKASHHKQLAELEYHNEKFADARRHLNTARQLYRHAARLFLGSDSTLQRHATLHWVQIQSMALDYVVGEPIEDGAWSIAFRSATLELETSDDSYWAHGSLCELWLLRLFEDDLDDEQRLEAVDRAKQHALAIRKSVHSEHFAIKSTKRQFCRYTDLWGDPEFSKKLDLNRSSRWDEKKTGVKDVAAQIVATLTE